jgi:hypothetical protein
VGDVFDGIEPNIRYRLSSTTGLAGYMQWSHLRTVLRLEREVLDARGDVTSRGERFFFTSLRQQALTSRQWVALIRARWGVENTCHHTFDTAFAEDDAPWITGDPVGALNVLLLRRIAYNMLALFRPRTLHGESTRLAPWKRLLRYVEHALIAATQATVAAIRPREPPPLSLRPRPRLLDPYSCDATPSPPAHRASHGKSGAACCDRSKRKRSPFRVDRQRRAPDDRSSLNAPRRRLTKTGAG